MTTWSPVVAAASRHPEPESEPAPCQAIPRCPHPAAWRFATFGGKCPVVLCEHHAWRWRAQGGVDEAIEAGAVSATRLSEVAS